MFLSSRASRLGQQHNDEVADSLRRLGFSTKAARPSSSEACAVQGGSAWTPKICYWKTPRDLTIAARTAVGLDHDAQRTLNPCLGSMSAWRGTTNRCCFPVPSVSSPAIVKVWEGVPLEPRSSLRSGEGANSRQTTQGKTNETVLTRNPENKSNNETTATW